MAKLGINTTPPLGTPLPDGGGNINSNFDELYTLLGDGNELYPGIVTSITAGSNISISGSTGDVTISVSPTAFTETLDTVTDRGNVTVNGIRVGVATASAFVKTGGTASQFLKADGSVDSNTYLTSASSINLDLDDVTSNGNTTANNIQVGSLVALGNVAAGASILAVNDVIGSSFKRIGGSANEFLKGDGTVDTNTYATEAYVNLNAGYWVQDSVGINTLSNVGIGTSAGVETLIVGGDARILGVLTVGSASVTIDGDNETISVGNTVSIGNTAIHVGSGVTISEDAIYVGSGVTITNDQIIINGESVVDRWKIGESGISTTKNVGIGTTADPAYQLKILGDVYIDGTIGAADKIFYSRDRSNTIGDGPVHIVPDNSSTQWSFRIDTADNLNFDAYVGSYSEVIWFQPDGGAHFSGKVELTTGTATGEATTKGYVDNLVAISTAGLGNGGGVGAAVTISDTPPGSPNTGDLWWDSTRLTGFIYYYDGSSSQWVEFCPGSGGGSVGGGSSEVTKVYVDNLVAISTSGLANTEYVDNKVGLATAGISTAGLASIVYVDQEIANVGGATTTTWTLGADGTNNYTFTGPGLTGAENDPTITLVRGQEYNFVNNMGAHPFRIQSTQGTSGTPYNDGITNNSVSNGTLEWDVQFDAPDTLYYQCTAHPNMQGTINILSNVGAADTTGLASIAYVDNAISGISTTPYPGTRYTYNSTISTVSNINNLANGQFWIEEVGGNFSIWVADTDANGVTQFGNISAAFSHTYNPKQIFTIRDYYNGQVVRHGQFEGISVSNQVSGKKIMFSCGSSTSNVFLSAGGSLQNNDSYSIDLTGWL